jgi:NTE family protein
VRCRPIAPKWVLLAVCLGFAASAPDGVAAAAPAERPKICLVLAGGGAKGIAHIGVLKVLEEMRIPVDCVVGTSMGSIVGAAYASGNDAAQIEATVRAADWNYLLSDQPGRAQRSVYAKSLDRRHAGSAEVGLSRTGLKLPRGALAGQRLVPFLRQLTLPGTNLDFDELPIPYRAVATDFETGDIDVLAHGDLALAVRASMSVPGAFAPVEIDDKLLVDGGMVRNFPVDVAKRFQPDVVIGVNLDAPLLKRADIESLFTVSLQSINILTAQNVARSLRDMEARDVLIAPDVHDINSADFAHALPAIERGEQAARAVAGKLAALSLAPDAYEAWRRGHLARVQPTPAAPVVQLDAGNFRRVNPQYVAALDAELPVTATLDEHVNALLATDDFERIDTRNSGPDDSRSVVLAPVEKSWGPHYLTLGLSLGADLRGGSDFTLYVDERSTWLTSSGLESRLQGSIGRTNSLAAELRQPLDIPHRWFVLASASAMNSRRDFFVAERPVSTYRLAEFGGKAAIGYRIGTAGEATIGAGAHAADENYYTGVPFPVLNGGRRTDTMIKASFSHDTTDNLDFPERGHYVRLDADFARAALGTSSSYNRIAAEVSQAFGGGPTSVYLTAKLQTAAGSNLPLDQAFALGGFLNLSGLREDQYLASRVAFTRLVVRHRFAEIGNLLPGLYFGGSLEGADIRDRYSTLGSNQVSLLDSSNVRVGAASIFLSAESALGPLYLAFGHSRAGQSSLYLYVGRP